VCVKGEGCSRLFPFRIDATQFISVSRATTGRMQVRVVVLHELISGA